MRVLCSAQVLSDGTSHRLRKEMWTRGDLHACPNVSVRKSDETVNSVIGTVLAICFLFDFILNFAALILFCVRKEIIWGMLSRNGGKPDSKYHMRSKYNYSLLH